MILDVFVQIYLVLRKLCIILHNESKQCRAGKGTSLFRFGRQYEELPVLTLTCLSHLFPCHDWQGYFFCPCIKRAAGLEEQHRKKRATWLWRKAVADFVNILLRKKVWLV